MDPADGATAVDQDWFAVMIDNDVVGMDAAMKRVLSMAGLQRVRPIPASDRRRCGNLSRIRKRSPRVAVLPTPNDR